MNLRAKKENVQPSNVLKDKTNVRKSSEGKGKLVKRANVSKALKENIANVPAKARKPKTVPKSQGEMESLIEPSPPDIGAAPPKESNCFGFSDEEGMTAPIPPYDGALTRFDCSKPYRFSLYVSQSQRVRYDPKTVQKVQNWSILNLSSIPHNSTNAVGGTSVARKRVASETVMSPDRTQWTVPLSSTPIDKSKVCSNPAKQTKGKNATVVAKKRKLIQKKITDLLPPSPKRTRAGNAKQHFTSYFDEPVSSPEEELPAPTPIKNTSDKPIHPEPTIDFPKPRLSGRWYEKRKKPEPLVAPDEDIPTEVILKKLSKRKEKPKSKKACQEEEDFEKWSATMNSEFSEIDQFEVSINSGD